MEKFSKGEFTLRDMSSRCPSREIASSRRCRRRYEQFENVMKLGPLNKVMGMIPGIPQMGGGEDGGNDRLKRFMYMMDSMTDGELDAKVREGRAEILGIRQGASKRTTPANATPQQRSSSALRETPTRAPSRDAATAGDEDGGSRRRCRCRVALPRRRDVADAGERLGISATRRRLGSPLDLPQVDLWKEPSRVDRIARGSGTHPMEIQALLRCHKQFEGVVTKMGKSGMLKGGDEQMVKQMQRNPQQVLQQLHKTMDPSMLRQMGGAQNLMDMMKKMSELESGKGGK